MKKILQISFFTMSLLLFFNNKSFALIDISAWGGYSFNGEIEGASNANPKALQAGLKVHYNTSLIPLLELGIGGYVEYIKIKPDSDIYNSLIRKSTGLDAIILVGLPIIHPYARFTYAIWDKLEENTKYLNAYGLGAGVELTFFPFLHIFGEYMFDNTDHNGYLKTHTVNLGLKVDI